MPQPIPPLRPDVRGGLFGLLSGALIVLGAGWGWQAIAIGSAYQEKGAQGAAAEFAAQMDAAYARGVEAGRADVSSCEHAATSAVDDVLPGRHRPSISHGGR